MAEAEGRRSAGDRLEHNDGIHGVRNVYFRMLSAEPADLFCDGDVEAGIGGVGYGRAAADHFEFAMDEAASANRRSACAGMAGKVCGNGSGGDLFVEVLTTET